MPDKIWASLLQSFRDPEGILTLDLQNRNLTFYTTELRSLIFRVAKVINNLNPEKGFLLPNSI